MVRLTSPQLSPTCSRQFMPPKQSACFNDVEEWLYASRGVSPRSPPSLLRPRSIPTPLRSIPEAADNTTTATVFTDVEEYRSQFKLSRAPSTRRRLPLESISEAPEVEQLVASLSEKAVARPASRLHRAEARFLNTASKRNPRRARRSAHLAARGVFDDAEDLFKALRPIPTRTSRAFDRSALAPITEEQPPATGGAAKRAREATATQSLLNHRASLKPLVFRGVFNGVEAVDELRKNCRTPGAVSDDRAPTKLESITEGREPTQRSTRRKRAWVSRLRLSSIRKPAPIKTTMTPVKALLTVARTPTESAALLGDTFVGRARASSAVASQRKPPAVPTSNRAQYTRHGSSMSPYMDLSAWQPPVTRERSQSYRIAAAPGVTTPATEMWALLDAMNGSGRSRGCSESYHSAYADIHSAHRSRTPSMCF